MNKRLSSACKLLLLPLMLQSDKTFRPQFFVATCEVPPWEERIYAQITGYV